MQIIDMGETAIDEETFDEYLEDIRVHYTADKVRHPFFDHELNWLERYSTIS